MLKLGPQCFCAHSMFSRIIFSTVRSFSNQVRISVKSPQNMEKCYLRYVEGHASFDMSFVYFNAEAKVRRQFNFSRRTAETVAALQQRIKTNIAKIVTKKSKKKKPSDPEDVTDVKVILYENNEAIDNSVLCHDLLRKNGLKLKIIDQEYQILINAPWILSISLPTSILSGFPVYPVNFKTQFAQKDQCIFIWYSGCDVNEKGSKIAKEHIKWEVLGRGFTFTPITSLIGKKLKVECVPGNGLDTGPVVEAVSSGCVEAGPGRCPFEDRHAFTQKRLSGKSMRVVSYNILADLYCDSDYTRTVLHPYCPPYALHIDYRKQLIIKELLGYNCDIACLQEVDKKIFENELIPVLTADGFDGVLTRKGKDCAEGLSCFFRKDRFRLHSTRNMIFAEEFSSAQCFAKIWDTIKENQQLVERVLSRGTAALITVLESIDGNGLVVIGNTHLYFHPDADHIRLIQGGLKISWLNEVVKEIETENPNQHISVLLCGDFNSVPSCGIYQLYTTGEAPSDLDDWKSKESEAVRGLHLRQDRPLASACGTPQFTNYTAGFAECLDYIFYDTRHFDVEQVIPMPSEEELKQHTALPSVVFPSDHIALVADLAFKR